MLRLNGRRPPFPLWTPENEQEHVLLRVFPFAAIALADIFTLAIRDPSWPQPYVSVAISGGLALWVLWFITLHPQWARRAVPMTLFYLGFVAFAAVLVVRAPWYGAIAFAGYLYIDRLRGLFVPLGLVATAIMMTISQMGSTYPGSTTLILIYLVLALFNIGAAGGMMYVGAVTQRQNQERKQVIEELAETNRKLEQAMVENAGLQAQLMAQAREAGVQDERQRMAREIHDTLAQGLTGIITQLEATTDAPDWRRHVDTAAALARSSLSEARRSVRAVRPEALETARLPEALREETKRWSSRTGVPAEVITTGTMRPMHPDVEVTLLRTAQEALANVAKHAAATHVGLTLSYMEDVVTLDVRDDGVGFDGEPKQATSEGGFGLTAMRQRVSRLAGSLQVESELGGGTAISASVPAIAAGGAR